MSRISTHVLDVAAGKPAAKMPVCLMRIDAGNTLQSDGETDADGRWSGSEDYAPGVYRLEFAHLVYLHAAARTSVFTRITIEFAVDGVAHYHMPILLSDNAFTTYRGS